MINFNRIAYQIDELSAPRGEAFVTRSAWTVSNLPPGLTLSPTGKLTGTPTTTGNYTCTVRVSTNWGTATREITITVQTAE